MKRKARSSKLRAYPKMTGPAGPTLRTYRGNWATRLHPGIAWGVWGETSQLKAGVGSGGGRRGWKRGWGAGARGTKLEA